MTVTIRNINENYGWPVTFTAATLEDAVAEMQAGLRTCGPEFQSIVVTPDDYEVIDE
jgi:hypothetical protein